MLVKRLSNLLGLIFILLVSACHQNASSKQGYNLISDSQNIVSTRASDDDLFFTLIQLKSSALLEKAQRVNGVTVIDQKLKMQIEAEQAQAILSLQQLSPNVQVVYRYKLVLNGLAIVGPASIFDQLGKIGVVTAFEKVSEFDRAVTAQVGDAKVANLSSSNSVKFIGADQLHQKGIKGQGLKVGVIDTGIDYTHALFGGPGTPQAYFQNDPSQLNPGFPTVKVAGGIDLVGTQYNASSLDFQFRIPKPDLNPLDEGGHGSHVAGTIAGQGNGITSYDGVAPEATLYAIKVFGERGSTSDMIVIAGLEFSADPNGDGILDDQLDVINLSLGSGFGAPKSLYSLAVKNLVRGGTSAVMAAGNSGASDYIVGAPGTSTEALSVAASIDDGEHNWKFEASLIKIGSELNYVKSVQALTTKPISTLPLVSGEFYFIGLADKDLTPAQAQELNGKVALIDRGGVSFNEKIKRAVVGGAIGVVMVNNVPGAQPIMMSTTDPFAIPAIMITMEMGAKIKAALNANPPEFARIDFLADKPIETPEVIDTITDFSSKGPRSVDGYLKPEITAPGYQIISAQMGSGDKAVQLSGTSMAAPHVAGVMALLKQSYKVAGFDLSPLQLKNIAMAHAKTLTDVKGVAYPVSVQGAGRVQADLRAISSSLVAYEPSISLGEISVEGQKSFIRPVVFKNLSGVATSLSFVFEGHPGIKLLPLPMLNLGINATIPVVFNIQVDASLAQKSVEEFGGLVKVLQNNVEIYRIPLLAVVHKKSNITTIAKELLVENKVELTIENKSSNSGDALFFNLLSVDDRKAPAKTGSNIFNTYCDLQSAGYRIVTHKNSAGVEAQFIQFAVKTYKIMTTWDACDVSILFDTENDGKIDQEIVATQVSGIPGLDNDAFGSVLIDTPQAQKIRLDFEAEIKKALGDPAQLAALAELEDYAPAIQDIQGLNQFKGSTLVVLEADLSLLKKDANNNLNFKILTSSYSSYPVEFDDYLIKNSTTQAVYTVSAAETDQPFYNFIENLNQSLLSPNESKAVLLNRGTASGDLIGYYPHNDLSHFDFVTDKQSQIIISK